jgi:small-conductance mechanosensitive channel
LLAEAAAGALRRVAAETREARDASFLARAALSAVIATAVWLALLGLAFALWRATVRWLARLAKRHATRLRVGGGMVISRQRVIEIVRRGAAALAYATMLVLTFEWLGYVLGAVPVHAPLERRTERVPDRQGDRFPRGGRARHAVAVHRDRDLRVRVPGRPRAAALLPPRRGGPHRVRSIDHDTAPPTRRLASIAIWLFAAVMAYPYIPGSDTEAFKGLSVLLGIMVSVGASGIVGQAASGFILMYTRTFRTGEYVRIGDREGTMTRIGMFTSTVRTGLGEELTMPNSLVLASVTTNYSRVVPGPGFMLAATVSIGYDAPWRQVHALLEERARRTRASRPSRRRASSRPRSTISTCSTAGVPGRGDRSQGARRQSPRRCTRRSRMRSTSTACRSCRRTTSAIPSARRSCRPPAGTTRRRRASRARSARARGA